MSAYWDPSNQAWLIQKKGSNTHSYSTYNMKLLPVNMALCWKIGQQLFLPNNESEQVIHTPEVFWLMIDRNTATRYQERTTTHPLSCQYSHAGAWHVRETSPTIEPRFITPYITESEVQLQLCLETAEDPWSNPEVDLGLHMSNYSTEQLNKLRGTLMSGVLWGVDLETDLLTSKRFNHYPICSEHWARARGCSAMYHWTVWWLQHHFTFSTTGQDTRQPQFIGHIKWVSRFCIHLLVPAKAWESASPSSFKVDSKNHHLCSGQICTRPGHEWVSEYVPCLVP